MKVMVVTVVVLDVLDCTRWGARCEDSRARRNSVLTRKDRQIQLDNEVDVRVLLHWFFLKCWTKEVVLDCLAHNSHAEIKQEATRTVPE